ncbi:hypothetical protein G3A39_39185 [Paraburkholderia aspalathi]|nr:hypothetical protein [Paraburkholderia aspalathi]
MHAPSGSVAGLCSASATMFAVGTAFLGYWGLNDAGAWSWPDVLVVTLAFIGFAALGSVPWLATAPVLEGERENVVAARRAFAIGVILIWMSVVATVII